MQYKVLVSAPYFLPVVDEYRARFAEHNIELVVAPVTERLEEAELLPIIGEYDGLLCGDDRVTPRVLDAAPRLKVIAKWGTGIDSIDKAYAESHGVAVCNTPNAFTLPVADSVMGYILAFARRQPWMDTMMKRGVWDKIPGRSLAECSLGVVGVGNCGKAVIHRAYAFGMQIYATDVRPIDTDYTARHATEMVSLEHLLANSDFISLNCDLNPSSAHIINDFTLSLMKPSAVLINTARGPLVNEAALVRALRGGGIAGAALDVFEVEPLPQESPLRHMSNVLLAPHNANSSPLAWRRVHENTVKNLLRVLAPRG